MSVHPKPPKHGWKAKAARLRSDLGALTLALGDPRTPWYAKALAVCVVAYAVSPIDLIPDFIPVLGFLDDLILLPVGVWFVMKLLPADVLADCRRRMSERKPVSRGLRLAGAVAIASLWLVILIWLVRWSWLTWTAGPR